MALPAITALAKQFDVHIIGPRWIADLYGFLTEHLYNSHPPPVADTILLLKPSLASAWRAREYKRTIGIGYGLRRLLLATSIQPMGHRIDKYNSLARQLGVEATTIPQFQVTASCDHTLPSDSIIFVVGTKSAQTVRWKYFSELAKELSRPYYFLGGPGDETIIEELSLHHPTFPTTLSLQQVASIAQQADLLIGIDSGLSHLAVAARNAISIRTSKNIIVYGSTSPHQTGPRNSVSVYDERPSCWPCYKKRCAIGIPCLKTPIELIQELL